MNNINTLFLKGLLGAAAVIGLAAQGFAAQHPATINNAGLELKKIESAVTQATNAPIANQGCNAATTTTSVDATKYQLIIAMTDDANQVAGTNITSRLLDNPDAATNLASMNAAAAPTTLGGNAMTNNNAASAAPTAIQFPAAYNSANTADANNDGGAATLAPTVAGNNNAAGFPAAGTNNANASISVGTLR